MVCESEENTKIKLFEKKNPANGGITVLSALRAVPATWCAVSRYLFNE